MTDSHFLIYSSFGGLNKELVRTPSPSGILPYSGTTWMDQFTVSSCEDVLIHGSAPKTYLYINTANLKSFCNRQICINPQQWDIFNFVPRPTKCAYCTLFDIRSVMYVVRLFL